MLRIVVEGVSHGQRIRHRIGPNLDTIFPNYPGLGPVPLVIRARDRKLLQLIAIENLQACARLIEREYDR